jgi:FkbM family methyltransferase
MTPKITIIISNYNSLHWLRIAVHQIRKHTKIPYHIVISEQSEDPYDVQAEYNGWDLVTVVAMEGNSSGYGTDYILKNIPIDSEYICSMDVDTFPISDDWLSFPIKLLEQYDLTWVGLRAEIESAYNLHYFHMGECYRIGRTNDFKLLSENVGWAQIKGEGFRDNAVMAHSWEDANFKHKKLSLPVTGRIGLTLTEGEYGRVIGNIAMHFCLAFTSTLHLRREKNVGGDYLSWEKKIKTLDPDTVVKEIMDAVKYSSSLQPLQYWDGSDHAEPPIDLKEEVDLFTHKKGYLSIPLHHIIRKYELNIIGVMHVGAHYGQEYLDYEDNGITNIIMFEPVNSIYAELIKRMPDSVICYRVALGNINGVETIFTETSNEGMSSSLLEPSLHVGQYPEIIFDGKESITVSRLDDIAIDRAKYNMMNIDVQGYELEVLKGAKDTLKGIDLIYCEVNKEELYKGCPSISDIDNFLSDFDRVDTNWIGGNWGDAIYIRK